MSESDTSEDAPKSPSGEATPDTSASSSRTNAAEKSDQRKSDGAGRKRKAPRPRDERPRERRGVWILALVALILALVALAGVGMLGWSWYQVRDQQTRITQLSDRVSQLGGQVSALEHTKADAGKIGSLTEQVHDNKRDTQARLKDIGESLRKLSAHLAGASTAYREDQAAALMRLAQARASLAHDPRGAAKALALARQTLADAADASLGPVQVALQREISALHAVPEVDTDGWYVKLESLAANVGRLPLAGQAVAKPSVPATGSSGFSWSGLGAAFKRAFSPLIVVRHGRSTRPLLPPDQAYFVRENLKLALAQAQLALLQHDPEAWQASLKRATKWLDTWFLDSNSDVEHAKSVLGTLASKDVAPDIPMPGAALAKLTTLQAQRSSEVTAPASLSAPSPASSQAAGTQ